MAYIGKGLVGVLSENKAVDTMSNPNGVLTTMTLSRTPGSVNNVEVYIDGVFQTPGDEFTLAGDVLTFTTAPATNAVVIAVVGNDSTIANVDNNTITGTMFPDGSVTDSKISDIVATKISGTLPALDGSSLTNLTTGNLEGTLPVLDGSPLTGVSGFRKNASDPLGNSNGTQGDVWVNTASGEVYVLTDATTNANVWTNVGDGSGTQPYVGMVATGGSITTDGDYKVHSFTTSGTFNFTVTAGSAPEVEYLVIAGGGSGGSENGGGGGGAGGYRTATGFSVSAQQYTVVVGAGGASVDGSGVVGNNGSNSVFSSITSIGGGAGGSNETSPPGLGANGGSGGGSAREASSSGTPGQGTSNQGYNGGNNSGGASSGSSAAGGGGAGAVGNNTGTSGTAGDGGAGLASDILVTGTDVIRAGGGGGGLHPVGATHFGQGGLGGGGVGGNTSTTAGTGSANTGSGGGGSGHAWYDTNSGAGGSGVVILRYKFQ